MALDQVDVMRHFGFERFSVFGHDRGGRVTHRMALDHPENVERAAVLDIIPTHYLFTHVDEGVRRKRVSLVLLSRARAVPRDRDLEQPRARSSAAATETLGAEYRRVFRIPGTLHAMCEDYRAGASIDFAHDGADLQHEDRVPAARALGRAAAPSRGRYDALAIWGERAARVTGKQMPGGHSFQESHPAETAAELRAFLSGSSA